MQRILGISRAGQGSGQGRGRSSMMTCL